MNENRHKFGMLTNSVDLSPWEIYSRVAIPRLLWHRKDPTFTRTLCWCVSWATLICSKKEGVRFLQNIGMYVPNYKESIWEDGNPLIVLAISQVDSHWLSTAAWVRSYGIYGGQSHTEEGFLRVLLFPLPIIPLTDPSSSRAGATGHLVASVIVDLVPLHPKKHYIFTAKHYIRRFRLGGWGFLKKEQWIRENDRCNTIAISNQGNWTLDAGIRYVQERSLRWPLDTLYPQNVATNFANKRSLFASRLRVTEGFCVCVYV
jgi:hypothetical protein